MLLQHRVWLSGLALLLGVALTAPAQAGEVDKYLPDDSEIVVTINVKQIVESPLFKKYGLENLQQLLKDNDEVGDVLKDLGFDPFTDADRIIIASPSGDDTDKGLMIFHGRFDVDKFKAKGEDAAKANGEHLKIHKRETGPVIYEVTHDQLPNNLFVAVADKNTLLVSFGKDYVVDALKKIDHKQATLKSKEIKTVLERMDSKQSLSVAVLGSTLAKSKEVTGVISKETLESTEAISGGVTIGEEIKLEIIAHAKTDAAAKEVNDKINDSLNDALLALGLLVKTNKDFGPALDVVKAIKATTKEKTVTVKGEISSEQLEKLSKVILALFGQ